MSKIEDAIWSVLIILALLILLYGVLTTINPILEEYFPNTGQISSKTDLLISDSIINSHDINFFAATLVLIFGAVKEELKYRLLLNCKWESIFFSLTLMVIDFLLLLFGLVKINENSIYSVFYYVFLLLITLGISTTLRPYFQRYSIAAVSFFEKWIWVILIFQLLLFSISHILFSSAKENFSWELILVNMLLAGGCITFIRMKFGMIYGVAFHFLYNFLFYLTAFYLYS